MKDGKIFVCDTVAGAVEVFDLVKKRARYFVPRGEGRLLMPINISIDADGTRYVADTGRSQVVIFDKDGNYLGAMGDQGRNETVGRGHRRRPSLYCRSQRSRRKGL